MGREWGRNTPASLPPLSDLLLVFPIGQMHRKEARGPGSLMMDGELRGNLPGTKRAGQGEGRCARASTASVSADKTAATIRNQKILFN